MFPERKMYFCKMFPERKIFFEQKIMLTRNFLLQNSL